MLEHEAEDAGVADSIGREWARFFGGLLAILVNVERLVRSVESLSATFDVPTFLAGVIVVTAATSLPDTLIGVHSATDGNSMTNLGNVLGSNTLDLFVAIPVGVLVVGSVPVDSAVTVFVSDVLTLTVVLLFDLLRMGLSFTRLGLYTLGMAYLVSVGWVIAGAAGVTSLLRN